jgi:GNAT superfamily N-acetyltransferase
VFNPNTLSKLIQTYLNPPYQRIVGPAYIGYGSPERLDLRDADRAVKLGSPDHKAIVRLMEACTTEEWEHGGSSADAIDRLFGGYSSSGELAALAGYELWGDKIAHIAIVTHPTHRGLGLGRAAVALAARQALDAGLVPQYRTLDANTASMNIATRLGFAEYGHSVYIRLKPRTN